ncbi:hypothetical protein D3C81_1526070 [compost metagenome]
MGNALDHLAEGPRRALQAAKAFRHQSAVNAMGFKGVNDIPRNVSLLVKLTQAGTISYADKQRFESRAGRKRISGCCIQAKRIHKTVSVFRHGIEIEGFETADAYPRDGGARARKGKSARSGVLRFPL